MPDTRSALTWYTFPLCRSPCKSSAGGNEKSHLNVFTEFIDFHRQQHSTVYKGSACHAWLEMTGLQIVIKCFEQYFSCEAKLRTNNKVLIFQRVNITMAVTLLPWQLLLYTTWLGAERTWLRWMVNIGHRAVVVVAPTPCGSSSHVEHSWHFGLLPGEMSLHRGEVFSGELLW